MNAVMIKENHGTKVAVTVDYEWQPIETCPLGVKVQGKTLPGGVAVYTTVTAATRQHYSHWAPLPRTPKKR